MTNLEYYVVLKAKTQQYNPLEKYQTQERSTIEMIGQSNCNKNEFIVEQLVSFLLSEHEDD